MEAEAEGANIAHDHQQFPQRISANDLIQMYSCPQNSTGNLAILSASMMSGQTKEQSGMVRRLSRHLEVLCLKEWPASGTTTSEYCVGVHDSVK
eukprot:746962-Hanusia_phi.AAC.14